MSNFPNPQLVFAVSEDPWRFREVSLAGAFRLGLEGALSVADHPQTKSVWWLTDSIQELETLMDLIHGRLDATMGL